MSRLRYIVTSPRDNHYAVSGCAHDPGLVPMGTLHPAHRKSLCCAKLLGVRCWSAVPPVALRGIRRGGGRTSFWGPLRRYTQRARLITRAKCSWPQRRAYIVPPPVIPFSTCCLQNSGGGGYISPMKTFTLLAFALIALTNSHAYPLAEKSEAVPPTPAHVGRPAAGAINGGVCGAFSVVICWKTA